MQMALATQIIPFPMRTTYSRHVLHVLFSCRWLEQPFIQYCLIPEMRWSRDTLILINATSAGHARTCDVNRDNPEGQLKYWHRR